MNTKKVVHFDATNLSNLSTFHDREVLRELNEIASLAKLPAYSSLASATAEAATVLRRIAADLDTGTKKLNPRQIREFAQRLEDVVDRAADDSPRVRQREAASREVRRLMGWLQAGGLGEPF